MKKFLHILFLLLPVIASGAGFVPVRNFPKADYGGGAQNWAACQDSLGRIYVGNYNGMLMFDGERWQRHYLSNYSTVRSLYYDEKTSRIYAGGSGDFGYFIPDDQTGELKYKNLSHLAGDVENGTYEIWNILEHDGKIWFQADNSLFSYSEGVAEVHHLEKRISTIAEIDNELFIGTDDGEIYRLNHGHFSPLDGTPSLEDKIIAILPYAPGNIMIATSRKGVFILDKNELSRFPEIDSSFFILNQLFCATEKRGKYAFGTVNDGVVCYDAKTGEVDYINRDTGLQNSTVLNLFHDRDMNLWICLDNGLDFANMGSPLKNLSPSSHSIGAGYDAAIRGNELLLATNQGLFVTSYPIKENPKQLYYTKKLQGQIWSLTNYGDEIFISADNGLWIYNGNTFHRMEGLPGAYEMVALSEPDKVLVSTYNGFYLLEREGGTWKNVGEMRGGADVKGFFQIDSEGYLWFAHWQKGVYRMKINIGDRSFGEPMLYNDDYSEVFPSKENISFALFRDEPLFSSYTGLLKGRYAGNGKIQVERDTLLNRKFPGGRYGLITSIDSIRFVITDMKSVIMAEVSGDSISRLREFSGSLLHDNLIPGFTRIKELPTGELIIPTQDGFCLLEENNNSQSEETWKIPFIERVYANRDSIVYSAGRRRGSEPPLSLPFSLNSLRLEFAYPYYSFKEGLEFSSLLEGFDTDWTAFGSEASREFTNLHEGDYRLRFRVRNPETGLEQESSFSFTILPPWYRSVWAKIIYLVCILLGFFLIVGIMNVRINKARKKAELRKQQELDDLREKTSREALKKDYEIASLKSESLEQQVKHKSDELSSATMNLIRKNEILRDLGEQITKIQNSVESSGSNPAFARQLGKLQASIDSHLSGDNDWSTFNRNFDIVYGDFTKKLSADHPSLSISDKRLCCYIRMGLSSKEIAPLINISVKSVEMARYRLRKKLNLSQEISLTDYLFSI